MVKPVDRKLHGIIDYAFSAVQLFMPSLLGLNEETKKTYQVLGLGFLGINALTNTPVGVKPVLSFKSHQKVDAAFLASLSLLTLSKVINKDRKALTFHLSFLSVAVAHYVMTDYDS